MSPILSNGIPIRIGSRDFLADGENAMATGACLPCSVAGTREVCQDILLPKPNGWFCPGSHFFLFLILWLFHAYVHSRSYSSSPHIPLFPHCWTPSVLLKSPSCFHVLLLVCGTLSWGLLAWARVEGFFFFNWRALETCQCSSSQESPTPQQPSGGHTSASALALEHFTNNMYFETVI